MPPGARWKWRKEFLTPPKLALQVDVNYGTGEDTDWRDTLVFHKSFDGFIPPYYALTIFQGRSPFSERLIKTAQWGREQYILTDEFTTMTLHPDPDQEWDVTLRYGGYFVQGKRSCSGDLGDLRDVIVALVTANRRISHEYRRKVERDNLQAKIDKFVSANPGVTTRDR